MKRSRKVVSTLMLIVAITVSANVTNAGIIVGFGDGRQTTNQCEEKNQDARYPKAQFDRGIIVGLTGIIVGFTGIIVGYADQGSECGYIPTSD